MSKQLLKSVLVLSMFVVTITWIPSLPISNDRGSNGGVDRNSSPISRDQSEIIPIPNSDLEKHTIFNIADDVPADGVLNPVTVEQSGYAASENISARTDSYQNLGYDLPLDVAHSWTADEAEVSVWNLEKLYAVNGSFTEGFPGINVNPNATAEYYPLGWSADSTDGAGYTDDVQLAIYDDTASKFVVVESQGAKIGQNDYGHIAGTRIVWTQTIQNSPYTEDFILSFDYFYLRGPLDKHPSLPDPMTGNCSIVVTIDGSTIWNTSLITLEQRGLWTNTGGIPITIIGAPSSFTFEIGLFIDEYMELDKRFDYDYNGIADGIGNAAYITVYLDDVSFVKAIPPTSEQVQLEFTVGGVFEPLTGSSGTYTATISNSSYWTTTPVSVTLTSNTSVSFDYKTRLYSHRFTDSNWRTNVSDVGVAYYVDHGLSSELTFYAYVGYLGAYEDPEMTIVFPSDWENLTVSDPFLTDLTGSCTIGSGSVIVPTSIINRLGWWEIKLESPNYAKQIKSQVQDVGWADETIFRIDDTTRADITIGTDTQTLGSLTGVNVSWFKPNDEVWVTEILPPGGVLGQIFSNSHTFLSGSSPAGLWWVEVYWTNGTEVAYNRVSFEIRHTAGLVAEPSAITTDAGSIIKGIVRYTDADTGAYLMDAFATLEGNWSGSSIPFAPNSIQNWWEADFDTSLTGAGEFKINVTASQLYYDDISCIISVRSINESRLTSPNAPWTAGEWGSIVPLTFKYESYHSPTETWGHVRNESDVSVSVNWTLGYWSVSEDSDLGIYTVELDSSTMASGTYLINATFSKPNHYTKTLLLTLILSPLTSSLVIFDGLSDRVDLEVSKIIKFGYLDKNGQPVQGANVVIDSISPSSGLGTTPIEEVSGEEGNYTISLTPYSATVFTVRFVATGSNSEPASAVFVLVVNDVLTSLEIFGDPSLEIGLTEKYNTTFRYELFNGTGAESAITSIVYSGPVGKLSWNLSEYGFGNYSMEFSASLPGTYVITAIAFKPFHQRASSSFSLIVRNIPTNLTLSVETSSEMGLTDTYEMTILYQMQNGTGIEDATIEVIHSGALSGITSQVTPLGLGNYSIQFNASLSGGYLVTIAASKQYYQGTSDSFLLVVREITTNMASLNGTSDFVGFGKDYRLFVNYTNGSGLGLVGANVSVVNADAGISWDPTQPEAPGIYSILLTPLSSNTFSLVVQANLTNHQTKVVFFSLTVTAIPTTLTTLNLSRAISVDQNITVYLNYQDEDSNPLENSSLDILNPPLDIVYSSFEELGAGVYRVTITPLDTGTFDIVFSASKDGYQTDYAGFTLRATIIQTALEISSGPPSATITYKEQYEILVFYKRTDIGQNVSGATILVETLTSGLLWNWSEDVDGVYRITLNPQKAGSWTLYISATKDNYVEGEIQFSLDVDQIQMSIAFVTQLAAVEGNPFSITVRLTEAGTSNPIDEAYVTYRFSDSRIGTFKRMNYTGIHGEYTISLSVPLYASSLYFLEIYAEKENYILAETLDVPFSIEPDFVRRNELTIMATGGSGAIFVAFLIALRIYSGRRKKQLDTDLVNKRRFDDADNIIGIIVMHKKSGIPIYSKIVKGGFEEGIVAAFISAVTHFRQEFEMFDEEAMRVIPISDIIRAVQTRNLICAFVTVRSASLDHNRKMEAYAMQVGTYLDDLYDESKPPSVLDAKIAEMLDYIYDTTMDGSLIKFYKIAIPEKFPRRFRYLEELMHAEDMKHCSKPTLLSRGIVRFGITEARGCTLVQEAIEKKLILPCEEDETLVSEIDFAEYLLENETKDKSSKS